MILAIQYAVYKPRDGGDLTLVGWVELDHDDTWSWRAVDGSSGATAFVTPDGAAQHLREWLDR